MIREADKQAISDSKKQKSEEYIATITIPMLNHYLDEWHHRDEMFWMQVFKYFYATLIVLFLPYLTTGIEKSIAGSLLKTICPWTAIAMSLFWGYVVLGYLRRIKKSRDTYYRINESLPDELKLQRLDNDKDKAFSMSMSAVICLAMFVVIVGLSILMLINQ